MIYEFVESFDWLEVGDRVRIKSRYIPPCASKIVPVHKNFINYIRNNGNCFIVRSIQQIDEDNAMIGVDEVSLALEIYQIEKISNSRKVINSGGN